MSFFSRFDPCVDRMNFRRGSAIGTDLSLKGKRIKVFTLTVFSLSDGTFIEKFLSIRHHTTYSFFLPSPKPGAVPKCPVICTSGRSDSGSGTSLCVTALTSLN